MLNVSTNNKFRRGFSCCHMVFFTPMCLIGCIYCLTINRTLQMQDYYLTRMAQLIISSSQELQYRKLQLQMQVIDSNNRTQHMKSATRSTRTRAHSRPDSVPTWVAFSTIHAGGAGAAICAFVALCPRRTLRAGVALRAGRARASRRSSPASRTRLQEHCVILLWLLVWLGWLSPTPDRDPGPCPLCKKTGVDYGILKDFVVHHWWLVNAFCTSGHKHMLWACAF